MNLVKSPFNILTLIVIGFGFCLSCSHRTILTSDAWAQSTSDTPDHFKVGRTNGFEMSDPVADESCRSPMIDPRDSTKIILFRSFDGRGDYEVPDGKYGVQKGQILRLDCATGQVVGIFKK